MLGYKIHKKGSTLGQGWVEGIKPYAKVTFDLNQCYLHEQASSQDDNT